MNTAILDYRISEFDTRQQADDYGAWFRKKVGEGLKCETYHTHDEVLGKLHQRRAERQKSC